MVRLILLDIEGTTTPIAFVHDVLFPFARARLADWLVRHAGTSASRGVIEALRTEHARDVARGEPTGAPWPPDTPGPAGEARTQAAVVAYASHLMTLDRKSTALKHWQGLIWEEGYQAGLLHGEVYPDVPPAMRRWRAAGVDVAIYSSGSELAQRRLFASTEYGDLTPLISAFFDTAVGPKTEADSYRRIAAALGHEPSAIVFVSDLVRELDAARAAGCQTRLSLRPGNAPQPDAGRHAAVASLLDLDAG
jgi:enolase-phosphatase E1